MNWTLFIGIALAPFMAFLMVALVARPIARLAMKMPDSWLKRFLFISWKV